MILSDWDIRVYLEKKLLVIDPLFEDTVRENGVDLRFGEEFCRFRRGARVVDTLRDGVDDVLECSRVGGEGFVVNPLEHVLTTTLEYVEFPNDLIGLVNLRSTFARYGLYIPPTVIDAGFKGNITIELVGSTIPVRVYPGQRFLHLILARTSSPVYKPYSGKYQGQRGVTPPRLDGSHAEGARVL
ncbi:dCTP deaminase [Desulfurococcus mucosus]|uniref:dCTP deaminase n=1 Tax=Desulfurococcus mucosus (strain ATCC 35584 / DSM 2162 / JCM 9187 / O7/1) TaxID=765177 RepID=E8RAK1_DESM0|nr:dCTP deaminase [Desulfurococcus mucosus]ADV65437.1 dCTP deaminase [Desulfurococcus mucosus DSM 2162]